VLLTRSPLEYPRRGLSARLACVKHAASVRPEPGSNSPTKTCRKTIPATNQIVTKEKPAKTRPAQTGKTHFGTGITNTLLSSQKTTTHPPQPHTGPQPGQLPHTTHLGRSRQALYRTFLDQPRRTGLDHEQWSKREGNLADRPAAPLARHNTRPAPAGLTTLADPFRNHKSAWTLVAARISLRFCTSKRNPQVRPACVRCPAGTEKVTCPRAQRQIARSGRYHSFRLPGSRS
jgi:hypothetical protein